MRSFFDVPAHPLFIHLVVVALPFVTLTAAAVLLVRPNSRKWAAYLVVGFGVVLAGTLLAKFSGDAFGVVLDGRAPIGKHRRLGDQTTWIVVATFVVSVANLLAGARSRASPETVTTVAARRVVPTVLLAATVIVAAVATVWMVRAAHEGARITWDGVFDLQ